MIRSIRIHHTSDGGTLEIGASEKTIIEVNGVKINVLEIVQLAQLKLAEVIPVDGLVTVVSHRCPEPQPVETVEPAKFARRKKSDD